mmetsp:Transcript_8349/g.14523  ORF Transcript_8349/g.14523 Transcript_8349/m.14523 type:complete len:240 (+) Transcript_8349:1211-1930(+)
MSQDEILLCTKNTMGTMVHQALGNMHPAFDNTQGVLSRLRSWDSYGYQLGATLDLFDELSMANFIEVVCNIKAIELYKQQAFISEFQLECPSGLPFLVLVETYTLPCPCPNLFLPNSTKGINVPTNHNVIVKCKLIPLPRQLQLLRFCYFLALVVLFIAILSGIGIIAFRWSRFFFLFLSSTTIGIRGFITGALCTTHLPKVLGFLPASSVRIKFGFSSTLTLLRLLLLIRLKVSITIC